MTNSSAAQANCFSGLTPGLDLTPAPALRQQKSFSGSLSLPAKPPPSPSSSRGEPKLHPNKCCFFFLILPPHHPLLWSSLCEWEMLSPQPLPFRWGLGCSPGDATPSHFLQRALEANIWNIPALGCCCCCSPVPAQMEPLSLQLGGKFGGLQLKATPSLPWNA